MKLYLYLFISALLISAIYSETAPETREWKQEDLKKPLDLARLTEAEKQQFNMVLFQRIMDAFREAPQQQQQRQAEQIPISQKWAEYGPYTSYVIDPYKTDPYTGAYRVNPLLGGDGFLGGVFGGPNGGGLLGGAGGLIGGNGGFIGGGYPGQYVLSAIFPNLYTGNGLLAGLIGGDIRNPIYQATVHPPAYISTASAAPFIGKSAQEEQAQQQS